MIISVGLVQTHTAVDTLLGISIQSGGVAAGFFRLDLIQYTAHFIQDIQMIAALVAGLHQAIIAQTQIPGQVFLGIVTY